MAAVRSRLLVANPCKGLTLPTGHRLVDTMVILTRSEYAERLLPAVPVQHRGIVSAAAGCGLRWGECAGLPWSAVDLGLAELRVRQVAVEVSGRLEIRAYPKSRAGVRTLPMPTFLVEMLKVRFSGRSPTPNWSLAPQLIRRCEGQTSAVRCGSLPWCARARRLGCDSMTFGTATQPGSSPMVCRSTSCGG